MAHGSGSLGSIVRRSPMLEIEIALIVGFAGWSNASSARSRWLPAQRPSSARQRSAKLPSGWRAHVIAALAAPIDLDTIVPFSPIGHGLCFATHALAAECLTDNHQQQKDSKHGVHHFPSRTAGP